MKKLEYLLLLLLCVPFLVKADAGPPTLSEYEITITNKNGAVCYERDGNSDKIVKTNKVYKYNTVLHVYQDLSKDYVYVRLPNDSEEGIYNNDCAIKVTDFKVGSSAYNTYNDRVYDSEKEDIFVTLSAIEMYKGPSFGYDKLNVTIPKGTVLKARYQTEDWYYVTYKGTTGWISDYSSPYYYPEDKGFKTILGYDASDIIFIYKDTKVYDINGKLVGTIPQGTEIMKYVRAGEGGGDVFSYVFYNNIEGYIDDYLIKGKVEVKTLKEVQIYDKNGKEIGKASPGVLTSDYSKEWYSDTILYLADSKTYVVFPQCEYIGEGEITNTDDDGNCLKEYIVYEEDDMKISDSEVKKTGYIKDMFNTKDVAASPVYKGIIQQNNNNQEVTNNEEETNTEVPNQTQQEETNQTQDNNKEEVVVQPKDNNQIILICALAGIILFLLAVIILLLINNKKNKNNNAPKEVKEETKETE